MRTDSPTSQITSKQSATPYMDESFINSIMYVGSGTGDRPFYHLEQAALLKPGMNGTKVVESIAKAWEDKQRIAPFIAMQNLSEHEAIAVKLCVIEAIGLDNLANEDHVHPADAEMPLEKIGKDPRAQTKAVQEVGARILSQIYPIWLATRCDSLSKDDVLRGLDEKTKQDDEEMALIKRMRRSLLLGGANLAWWKDKVDG